MVESSWWLVSISILLLLARFLTAAGIVRLFVPGTGMGWGAGLAVLLSVGLAPLAAESSMISQQSWPVALPQEILRGLWLGFSLTVLITGMQLLSQLAFSASPWGMESSTTPTGPLQKLFLLIVVAGFLHVRGDQIVLQMLVESVQELRLGDSHFANSAHDSVVAMISGSFSSSLQLASPMVAAMLFTHLLLGLLSRSISPAWFATLHGVTLPILLIVLAIGLIAWAHWLPDQLPLLWQAILETAGS